jgi:hypothetical protein
MVNGLNAEDALSSVPNVFIEQLKEKHFQLL